MNPNQLPTEDPLIKNDNLGNDDNDSGDESDAKPSRRSGRRKIKIEYIEDKNRRHITFSKRKAGIMKKAYELSTLTGTQVLLLVVSETGLVYTFTTVKLQPIVTKPEGKNLIQSCLNAPDPAQAESNDADAPYNPANSSGTQSRVDMDKKSVYKEAKVEPAIPQSTAVTASTVAAPSGYSSNNAGNNGPYQQPYGGPPTSAAPSSMPPLGASAYGGHPNYMGSGYHPQQQQPPQQQQQNQQPHQSPQQQQQPYGQMPGPGYYGNQQQAPPHYLQQPQQHPGYWSNNPSSSALRQQEDEKARRGLAPTKK